jgi:DNA phosphorothioation-dependent restriction protein DptF
LNKITAQTSKNKFYSEYSKNCKNCDTKDICPICLNYQLLSDEKIQEGIISAIIENIVKNKLIVSTRKLLNMIYEIIVDERYWNRGSLEPRKIPWKQALIIANHYYLIYYLKKRILQKY